MIVGNPTDIDRVRAYMLLGDEAESLDELLAYLRRELPQSPAMLAGGAFHKALELAARGEYDHLEADGFSFEIDCDGEIPHYAEKELWVRKIFEVGTRQVLVRGRLDGKAGDTVADFKTTSKYDPDKYLEGYQWRFYLGMTGAYRFVWHVFRWLQDTKQSTRYSVREIFRLEQFAYPELEADLQSALALYVGFVETHLPERILKPCRRCGTGYMEVRRGPRGPFRGCSNYPACHHTEAA